jgi:DNA repair protein RecN (Recombination protein N)
LKVGAVSERPFLNEVSISGIGVIEKSNLTLEPGLTVITGETGAGKTMVLTALNLVLGGKADSGLVRHGQERAVANATFTIPNKFVERFEDHGVLSEAGELILTRTVTKDGKSKAVASGTSVSASALQEISEELVMVHGQAASQTLTKTSKHLELLDLFAQSDALISKFQSSFNEANELAKRIKAMKQAGRERDAKLQALREFAEAVKKVKPRAGEIQEINDEISRLSSVENLTSTAGHASAILDGADQENAGVLSQLSVAKKALEKAATVDQSLSELSDQLNDLFFQVQDVAAGLSSYLSDLAADPARLDYLQNRKAELNLLIKRHSKSNSSDINQALHELIELATNLDNEIADLEGGDDRILALEKELFELQKISIEKAKDLSKHRAKFAKELSARGSDEIHALSMPSTNLIVEVKSGESFQDLTVLGFDEVNFFLQTHKDGPLVSIAKGASGGELSRVALAIEVVIAMNEEIGTYIFDEVDAGVGGKAAIEVGRRLKSLSKVAQVIVVTHLPQVAAWGDTHFVVSKDESGSVSLSQIKKLSKNERVEEIARMLAGHEDSISARKHAEELLTESR